MYTIDIAGTDKDLMEIIKLQKVNLEGAISLKELNEEGFVTVVHDIDSLKQICGKYKHIVARDDERIIAYALVMSRAFSDSIPVLKPMFDQIDNIYYQGECLKDQAYIVMGQICIDKSYRSKGVFKGLYDKMKSELKGDFDYIITEVAQRNQRSIRAHEKVGFITIKEYESEKEDWVIILLET